MLITSAATDYCDRRQSADTELVALRKHAQNVDYKTDYKRLGQL